MTEKELGRALLKLDMAPPPPLPPPPPPDSHQLTRKILARDQRQIRQLIRLAAFFWVLAVAGPGLLIWVFLNSITPRLEAYAGGRREFQEDVGAWLVLSNVGAEIILACVIALLLAATCTILLILASRRATLRQINANLAEISEQLKLLRQEPPSQPPRPIETA